MDYILSRVGRFINVWRWKGQQYQTIACYANQPRTLYGGKRSTL